MITIVLLHLVTNGYQMICVGNVLVTLGSYTDPSLKNYLITTE